MSQQRPKALWGGRFTESTDSFVQHSLHLWNSTDEWRERIFRDQSRTPRCWPNRESNETGTHTIIDGLRQIESEIEAGEFSWSINQEDVHMNVESRLIDLIGDTGKKLHTGRSRNDQVATDIRLWLRNMVDSAFSELTRLQSA